MIWFFGLFVFFDDYVNMMLFGNIFWLLIDWLKIVCEKFVFLVDFMVVFVLGLVLISIWVVGEIGYVENGIVKFLEGVEWKFFELFVVLIFYCFYVLWVFVFVLMLVIIGCDYGFMRKVE